MDKFGIYIYIYGTEPSEVPDGLDVGNEEKANP